MVEGCNRIDVSILKCYLPRPRRQWLEALRHTAHQELDLLAGVEQELDGGIPTDEPAVEGEPFGWRGRLDPIREIDESLLHLGGGIAAGGPGPDDRQLLLSLGQIGLEALERGP